MATLAAAGTASPARRAPLHLWIVGVVSLLWNAFGAFDYLMTQLQAEWYMGAFTEEQLAYFYGFPAWATAAWALGVWGAVAGSVGLLLRRAWAVWAFGASLVGLVVTSLYTLVLSDGLAVADGAGHIVFTVVIWAVTIGLFLYARAQARRGVLR